MNRLTCYNLRGHRWQTPSYGSWQPPSVRLPRLKNTCTKQWQPIFNQTPNLNLESWLCISLFTLDHNLSFLDRKILHMHMEKRWAKVDLILHCEHWSWWKLHTVQEALTNINLFHCFLYQDIRVGHSLHKRIQVTDH